MCLQPEDAYAEFISGSEVSMSPKLTLVIKRDGEILHREGFERETIKIGRLASAHLRLDSPEVFRIHAVVELLTNGRASVIDMGSPQGTLINGTRIRRHEIGAGDEITIGPYTIVVEGILTREESLDEVTRVAPLAPASAFTSSEPTRVMDTEAEAPKVSDSAQDIEDATEAVSMMPPEVSSQEPYGDSSSTKEASVGPVEVAAAEAAAIDYGKDEGAGRVLEVRVRWGSDTASVHRFPSLSGAKREDQDKPSVVTFGLADEAEIVLPTDGFGGKDALEVLRRVGHDGWHIQTQDSMMPQIVTSEGTQALSESSVAGRDGSVQLADDMLVRLHFDAFTADIQYAARNRAVPFVPIYDNFLLQLMMSMLAIMFLFIASTIFFVGGEEDNSDDLMSNLSEFQSVILDPPEKKKPQSAGGGGEKSKAYEKEEGKAGKKKAKTKNKRMAVKAPQRDNKAIVDQKMAALFGGKGSAGLQKLIGATDGSGEMEAAIGNITGGEVGDASGNGGFGLRGSGGGGGGKDTGTVGIGKVGTKGFGGGKGKGYGGAGGGLGGKGFARVSTRGKPQVRGSMDAAIIRRIVKEHASEIRYCYERELTKTPGLYGKVVMNWVIGTDGRVKSAKKASSQMRSPAVERCMASKIKRWKFPRPKGGGSVVVNYPFVFKQAN